MKPWILLLFSVLANTGANFLLRHGSTFRHTDVWRYSLWLLLTVSVLALSLWSYGRALRQLPLNFAYPILTGGAIVVVASVEGLTVGGTWNAIVGAGIGCVVAGIAVLGTLKERSPS